MKRRGVSNNSPVKQFIGGVYKVIGFWFGELKARVRNESQNVVVYKRVMKGTGI